MLYVILTVIPAFNLTSWGFRDVETYDDNGSLGGMLTKLLLRGLPQHYRARSVYAHFPFMVPGRMREFMLAKDPDMEKQYVWEKPEIASIIKTVEAFDAVVTVVTDPTFATPYEDRAGRFTDGYGFYIGSNNISKVTRDRAMVSMSPPCYELLAQEPSFIDPARTIEPCCNHSICAVLLR